MNPPIHHHPAGFDDTTLLSQCKSETYRSSGPGGQHRNKTDSAVRLTHHPTGQTATATERREQAVNRKVALRRLRINLAIHHRQALDYFDQPSDLWRSRVHAGRIAVNPNHADFAVLLAELMDVLAFKKWEPKPTATLLDVSSSQIIKLLKAEPAALAKVNQHRAVNGKHALK